MWDRRQFLAAGTAAALAPRLAQVPTESAQAAADVLRRAIGLAAARFHFATLPHTAKPAYTLEASGGEVRIAGTSAVAMCRAAYSYLRGQCEAMICWSGSHLDLPVTLPSLTLTKVECPYRHIQYLNPCTYGYTMAWWDWPRWERELDWMALHGITMPLAMEGQE